MSGQDHEFLLKLSLSCKFSNCVLHNFVNILSLYFTFHSLQFVFDFVETHRIKECHVSACTSSGVPVHGTDSPPLPSYGRRRKSKDRPVGVWNVDGEVLRQASLSLRYS